VSHLGISSGISIISAFSIYLLMDGYFS
jgi:hypothetical protein